MLENIEKVTPKHGFLRIQLDDQTDSKVLLGQYRCTDVHGEFSGYYWNISIATQDDCTVLTNLLENDSLNVPGFRENLKIASGFQLFATLRTQKSVNASHNSAYSSRVAVILSMMKSVILIRC
jgi:midasin